MDTIYALATAPGKAGVAVIRVSGPQAKTVCYSLSNTDKLDRKARLKKLHDRDSGVIDHALVLGFQGPNSFTGEDVVEFHTHGGPAVISLLLEELALFPECRIAEPGEFTWRAFSNGQLDLAQVEGLADLINAETEQQRRSALTVSSGEYSRFIETLNGSLLKVCALLEASIDFPEEEIPDTLLSDALKKVEAAIAIMENEIAGYKISERLQDGFEVAIVGPPNSGKSTLMNRLIGREIAITSDISGTTRDILEARMDLNGIPVTFFDTAGIRETCDEIEKIGIDRAISRANSADVRVFLCDPNDIYALDKSEQDFVFVPKDDTEKYSQSGISGLTGFGVDRLKDSLSKYFSTQLARASKSTKFRHISLLKVGLKALESARIKLVDGSQDIELIAEDVNLALSQLASILGKKDVEAVLGEIFSSFCIGK